MVPKASVARNLGQPLPLSSITYVYPWPYHARFNGTKIKTERYTHKRTHTQTEREARKGVPTMDRKLSKLKRPSSGIHQVAQADQARSCQVPTGQRKAALEARQVIRPQSRSELEFHVCCPSPWNCLKLKEEGRRSDALMDLQYCIVGQHGRWRESRREPTRD